MEGKGIVGLAGLDLEEDSPSQELRKVQHQSTSLLKEGGGGVLQTKDSSAKSKSVTEESETTTEWSVVFLCDSFEETLSSSARSIRALTSVTSLSSDDTSSSSQSYVSTIRPLFLPEYELGAEALELRMASLALTLLYLALKSLVCVDSGLC
ncbi:hypothetical protein Tco_1413673 [Tanacetum coccineum]